jgi:dihydropyrimidinase
LVHFKENTVILKIIDFVIPTKEQLPLEAYHQWRSWADPKVCCDYALSVAITSWNEEVAKEMEQLTHPEYGNFWKFFKLKKMNIKINIDHFKI